MQCLHIICIYCACINYNYHAMYVHIMHLIKTKHMTRYTTYKEQQLVKRTMNEHNFMHNLLHYINSHTQSYCTAIQNAVKLYNYYTYVHVHTHATTCLTLTATDRPSLDHGSHEVVASHRLGLGGGASALWACPCPKHGERGRHIHIHYYNTLICTV